MAEFASVGSDSDNSKAYEITINRVMYFQIFHKSKSI